MTGHLVIGDFFVNNVKTPEDESDFDHLADEDKQMSKNCEFDYTGPLQLFSSFCSKLFLGKIKEVDIWIEKLSGIDVFQAFWNFEKKYFAFKLVFTLELQFSTREWNLHLHGPLKSEDLVTGCTGGKLVDPYKAQGFWRTFIVIAFKKKWSWIECAAIPVSLKIGFAHQRFANYRMKYILEYDKDKYWQYIPSKENAADRRVPICKEIPRMSCKNEDFHCLFLKIVAV